MNSLFRFTFHAVALAAAAAALPLPLGANPPPVVLNYQGRVTANGLNLTGTAHFRFALVDGATGNTLWGNSAVQPHTGMPYDPVVLPVSNGLFSVRLGDTALPEMNALNAEVFAYYPDLRLRVWVQLPGEEPRQLAPDHRIVPPPTAHIAHTVPNGAITREKLDFAAVGRDQIDGAAVDGEKLAPGAVGTAHLAAGAVTTAALAPGAITADRLASGAVGASQLAAGAVSASKLAAGAVTAAKFDPALGFGFTNSVVSWGEYGQGVGTAPALPAGRRYIAVAAGANHALALRDDGRVFAWGNNESGQIEVPALPAGLTYLAIGAGGAHSLAFRSDGQIVGWGANHHGQANPPDLPPGTGVIAFAAGDGTSYALTDAGTIVAFGRSNKGQLDVPALPPGTQYIAVAAGFDHAVAIRSDGVAVAWGDNTFGQCWVPFPSPGRRYVSVAASIDHTIGVLDDGTVVWAASFFAIYPPPPAPPGTKYISVALGYNNNGLALRDDGAVVAWESPAITGSDLITLAPTAPAEAISAFGHTAVALLRQGLRASGTLAVDGLHSSSPVSIGRPAGTAATAMLEVGGDVRLHGGAVRLQTQFGTHPFPEAFIAPGANFGHHLHFHYPPAEGLRVWQSGRASIGAMSPTPPAFPLEVAGRLRSRGENVGETAGLWLATKLVNGAPNNRAFVGLRDADAVGFSVDGAWNLLVHGNGSTVLGAPNEGASPHRLDVNGTARVRGDFLLNGRGGGWGNNGGAGRALVDGGPASGPNSISGGGLFINFSNDFGRVVIGSNVTVLGTVTQTSDLRLKRDIAPLPDPRAKLASLHGVSFAWADPGAGGGAGRQIGLLAQEVEAAFPELVATDGAGHKAVAYQNLVPVLLEAIKAQQAELDALRAAVVELRQLVSDP